MLTSKWFVLSVTLLSVSACATIIHGTTQDVGLSSTPTGAKVTVDNQPGGTTPYIAKLSRKDNHILRFELAGYAPAEATLTRKVDSWVWGNIVFGGIVGLAVDAISGGMYKLTPEQVSEQLSQKVSLNTAKDQIFVFVTLAPDPNWQRIGTLAR